MRELLYAIAAEYKWPDLAPTEITSVPMKTGDLDHLVGSYESSYEVFRIRIDLHRDGQRLFLTSPRLGIDSEVVFTSPTSFIAKDGAEPFDVVVDARSELSAALDFGGLQIMRRKEGR